MFVWKISIHPELGKALPTGRRERFARKRTRVEGTHSCLIQEQSGAFLLTPLAFR